MKDVSYVMLDYIVKLSKWKGEEACLLPDKPGLYQPLCS